MYVTLNKQNLMIVIGYRCSDTKCCSWCEISSLSISFHARELCNPGNFFRFGKNGRFNTMRAAAFARCRES